VLVVVPGVHGVLVPVVNVVHVVVVLDGLVTAILAVSVLFLGVLGDGLVLVVVAVMQGVMMGAVHVVGVTVVLDGLVAAVRAVLVLGHTVFGVEFGGAHDGFPPRVLGFNEPSTVLL
jgi:hypothetical protein